MSVATTRLRLLQDEIAGPRARPAGPSGRTRNPFPAGPVPAGMLDHMIEAYQEAVSTTRAVAPDAGPAPADHHLIYTWMDRTTRDLDDAKRIIIEVVMLKQSLENAVRLGDHDVVRPISCPTCGCWSLFWNAARRRVVCAVDDCVTAGRPSVWTFRELAEHAVEKSPTRAAT